MARGPSIRALGAALLVAGCARPPSAGEGARGGDGAAVASGGAAAYPIAVAVVPTTALVVPPGLDDEPAGGEVLEAGAAAGAGALAPLKVPNVNTLLEATGAVYDAGGGVDPEAAAAVDRVLTEPRADAVRPASRRLLQLAARAAWHFGAREIAVVSAFREKSGKNSKHRSGDALDFSLPGVSAARLASYLRRLPRVGVGVYTHPRTQFVHLDVRDTSYHWIDGSPPGRHWREQRLQDPGGPARDAAYRPEQDLPEIASQE